MHTCINTQIHPDALSANKYTRAQKKKSLNPLLVYLYIVRRANPKKNKNKKKNLTPISSMSINRPGVPIKMSTPRRSAGEREREIERERERETKERERERESE